MLAHMYLLMYLNIYFYFSRHDYVHFFFFAGHWLAMSNSCINPFIYAIFSVRNKMVREGKLRQIWGNFEVWVKLFIVDLELKNFTRKSI